MMWLAIATGVQFVILLGITLVVLSLARQIGILHERTAPASLNRTVEHLHSGDRLPEIQVRTLSGTELVLGGTRVEAGPTALLFIAADCPICRSVLPAYHSSLVDAGLNGYWVGDGVPLQAFESYASVHAIDPERLLLSQELGLRLGVRALPALALIDADQRLISLDVVNAPAEVQRLLVGVRQG